MQITSVTLKNVRRFVDPVRIDGFGPGLNVLVAPNEHGKSTFFEALHAAFFVSHRSFDKTVKALVPRVGGDPEVVVEFQADGAQWKLMKCWSSRPGSKDAKLWRDGTLVAQKSEADAMLSGLLKPPSDGGPAGLLWVRQGVVGLDSGGEEQQARRDIMTSVAGEVEAMTGGRRMEAALASCAAFLAQHLTGTGRPKANGGLQQALAEVEALTGRRDQLRNDMRALQQDLERRRQLRRELAELDAPEAHQERAQALEKTRETLEAAQAHDRKVKDGESEIARLSAQLESCKTQIEALNGVLAEAGSAQDAVETAKAAVAERTGQNDAAQARLETAKTAHDTARKAVEQAASDLRRAMRAKEAAAAATRRAELADRIEKAGELGARIADLRKQAGGEIVPETLDRLEELARDLSIARKSLETAAAAFSITYSAGGEGRITRAGQPVEGGKRHPVLTGTVLDLDGIGRLEISAAQADDGAVAEAEAALKTALAEAGMDTVAAARDSLARRRGIEAELRQAEADLKALAPHGLDALRTEHDALPEPVETEGDVPDVALAEAAEMAAQETLAEASEALEAARAAADATRDSLTRAEVDMANAENRARRAQAALASHPDPAKTLADLRVSQQEATGALQQAQRAQQARLANAPDLGAAQAAMTRAESVLTSAKDRISWLREELAGLNSRIAVVASAAVEEELALTEDQLQQAEDRLARIRFDIAVHQRLERALQAARDTARENYVAAVHRELLPLLRMIWPDAEPVIDADTGLITRITRRGEEEEFEVLSGGTQEQISLLVRLAFARILARDGRPAPVILDDAIVYTDDDRIEQMFNALTRQSQDLQVIVFSCRQRAFRALGGTALAITQAGDAA
ncbi:AAA family ATPase [Jhaorihella thermophila]|uniref:DNA repair exonuclease SbcCD ATPase subunit n=1 Tax=Jhaorihella thermophila TaxID=488547 RepID=A0A1H5YKC1_9RHOB|nr:AAA family ATPase [Jhaorihella thermophila]SEG23836.1 DNA repair exonuclease SbcCD ATPase subunit [Jhaorihella thermophila]